MSILVKENKILQLDMMKGLAIFSVVFGHVFLWMHRLNIKVNSEFFSKIYEVYIVYLEPFQIPAFLFSAGFLLNHIEFKRKPEFGFFLKKKFFRLCIPYILYSFIAYLTYVLFTYTDIIKVSLEFSLKDIIISMIRGDAIYKSIDGVPIIGVHQYWFLYNLFIFYVFAFVVVLLEWKIVNKVNKKVLYLSEITILLLGLLVLLHHEVILNKYILFLYFYAGFYTSRFNVYLKKNIITVLFLSILAMLILLTGYIHIIELKKYLITLFMIIIIFKIPLNYVKNFKIVKSILFLGENSMEIFLYHMPFIIIPTISLLNNLNVNINIIIVVTLVVGLFLPILFRKINVFFQKGVVKKIGTRQTAQR